MSPFDRRTSLADRFLLNRRSTDAAELASSSESDELEAAAATLRRDASRDRARREPPLLTESSEAGRSSRRLGMEPPEAARRVAGRPEEEEVLRDVLSLLPEVVLECGFRSTRRSSALLPLVVRVLLLVSLRAAAVPLPLAAAAPPAELLDGGRAGSARGMLAELEPRLTRPRLDEWERLPALESRDTRPRLASRAICP